MEGTHKQDMCDVAAVATETRILLLCLGQVGESVESYHRQKERRSAAGYRQGTDILRNTRTGWLCKQSSPHTQVGRLHPAFP